MKNFRKRYASDCLSSNLQDDDRHHNTDTLHAVAIAVEGFAAMILRARQTQRITKDLRDLWRMLVIDECIERNWYHARKDIADIALWYFCEDHICPTCRGRGSAVIIGSPILSDVTCDGCGGTGRKEIKFDPLIEKEVKFFIERLNMFDRTAAALASKKLQRD